MRLAVAAVALLLTSACGGGSESSDKPDNSLRNDADATLAPSAGKTLKVGEFAEGKYIGRIQVSAIKVGGDDLGPWLEATVRMENSGNEALSPAQLDVVCTGDKEPGGYQIDSTFDFNKEIPAESFREGVTNLLFAGAPRTGEPTTECATPAFIEITPAVSIGDDPQPKYAIPDNVIADINAKLTK
ncbi:MAG: hypothetical protein ACRDWY_18785 [Actinomycetes bacterium]